VLRQQQQETIDQVKKTYYSILQTQSGLTSVRETVKSYQELDKVTGDFVVQQVALKADHLIVQTRLAQIQYEELELSNGTGGIVSPKCLRYWRALQS